MATQKVFIKNVGRASVWGWGRYDTAHKHEVDLAGRPERALQCCCRMVVVETVLIYIMKRAFGRVQMLFPLTGLVIIVGIVYHLAL